MGGIIYNRKIKELENSYLKIISFDSKVYNYLLNVPN